MVVPVALVISGLMVITTAAVAAGRHNLV